MGGKGRVQRGRCVCSGAHTAFSLCRSDGYKRSGGLAVAGLVFHGAGTMKAGGARAVRIMGTHGTDKVMGCLGAVSTVRTGTVRYVSGSMHATVPLIPIEHYWWAAVPIVWPHRLASWNLTSHTGNVPTRVDMVRCVTKRGASWPLLPRMQVFRMLVVFVGSRERPLRTQPCIECQYRAGGTGWGDGDRAVPRRARSQVPMGVTTVGDCLACRYTVGRAHTRGSRCVLRVTVPYLGPDHQHRTSDEHAEPLWSSNNDGWDEDTAYCTHTAAKAACWQVFPAATV